MLAVASLAAGVVASLTAPSAHAGVVDSSLNNVKTLTQTDVQAPLSASDSTVTDTAGPHTNR
ncbi:hypothetical protein GCM10010193_07650 [Kitasatospora atroaurantiaca]|uniref:Secreted protein n=2 Tax=Kitasatospora atroaurantiaca TaxID=285545 RepID=A0A561EJD8_9ACTN|nr:hypothetical protein FB465_0652 [Kitasatospora atroaurantiaca]